MAIPQAELPREYIDTDWKEKYDGPADIVVNKGDDLQAALEAIKPGEILELQAGANFHGNYQLKRKNGEAEIVIR